MSRIGKKPIVIPDGVLITIGKEISVKGPKGEHTHLVPEFIKVEIVDNTLVVSLVDEAIEGSRAKWGLHRSLLAGLVTGVSEGFFCNLDLVGLGYRVKKDGEGLEFNLGLSHPVKFPATDGISFEVTGNTEIRVSGISKQLVNATAASIRDLKKPEPYKGKGIKYRDEVIKRKAGKAGKVGAQ